MRQHVQQSPYLVNMVPGMCWVPISIQQIEHPNTSLDVMCCRVRVLKPATHPAEDIEARYARTVAAVRARLPRHCPRCGSVDIVPDFTVREAWFCGSCKRPFCPED